MLSNTGRPREAEPWSTAKRLAIRRALAEENPALTELRTSLAASHNNLGLLLAQTGRLAEGEAEQRKALAIRQALADRNPAVSLFREHVAASHFNLGMLLLGTGRPSEAEAERAARPWLYTQRLADDNPAVSGYRSTLANTHVNLGRLLADTRGRPREAEAEYRKGVLAIQRTTWPIRYPAVTGFLQQSRHRRTLTWASCSRRQAGRRRQRSSARGCRSSGSWSTATPPSPSFASGWR